MSQNCFSLTFSPKCHYEIFGILHGDNGQHCATSTPGAAFQKNDNPGIKRGLSLKKSGLGHSW